MQNRVNVVGRVGGDKNEHHCQGEQEDNYGLDFCYTQQAVLSRAQFSDSDLVVSKYSVLS